MSRRTTKRTAAALAAVCTTAIVIGVAPAALAANTSHSCIDGTTAASLKSSDADGVLARVQSCIANLSKQADAAGRAAQQADEHYLRAQLAATAARTKAVEAASRATAAERTAELSRDRAAAVTAYMARTGQGDQATSVMLDGKSASKTLYALSRVSQLTVNAAQVSEDAATDSAAATTAGQQADTAALSAQADSDQASAAFKAAKQAAASASLLVQQQIAEEKALEAEAGIAGAASQTPIITHLPPNASVAQRVLAFAEAQIGDPYVFAAAGPSSWDCSGLTMGAYASVGIDIGGHSATAQYDLAAAQGHLVPYDEAQAGDLLFYTDGGGDMYHVAIYAGNGMMVEAPQEGEDVRLVAVRTPDLVNVVARPTA